MGISPMKWTDIIGTIADRDYNEDDQIVSLCDTPNITCYEIDGLKICKLKQSNQMVVFSQLSLDSYKEQREELERILQSDEEAKKYIEIPKIKESTLLE